jgi:hypothetical protein
MADESEILTRQRHHVDLSAGWLRIEPGETKSGEGRNLPLTRNCAKCSKAKGGARLKVLQRVSRVMMRGRTTSNISGRSRSLTQASLPDLMLSKYQFWWSGIAISKSI